MSSNPSWWPYRLPIEEALKKSVVLVLGVVIGANVIEHLWKPMETYETELDKGKLELLQNGYESPDDKSSDLQNEFKIVFKKFKRRVPSPNFSDVIDIKTSSMAQSRFVFTEDDITEDIRSTAQNIGLIDPSEWVVYFFNNRPGLFILPGILKKEASVDWLLRTISYAKPPNTTNLTLHGTNIVDEPEMFNNNLRWTTLGVEYNWDTKEYPSSGRPLPDELKRLGSLVCESLKLGGMRPDAAIVNYYPPKSTLSPHVDRSERSNAPLISLSLGQVAVYLTGGTTLAERPLPLWLSNGDILVMHGEQRKVYHAIPCVGPEIRRQYFNVGNLKATRYLNSSRVNITIRQVNP